MNSCVKTAHKILCENHKQDLCDKSHKNSKSVQTSSRQLYHDSF
jgi:hypothetical protein